jgi:hypothetical protein
VRFVPHWVHPLLRWLSLHWGDVVPAWLAVIVAAVFGWLSWRSSRQARTARDEARAQADRSTTAAVDAAAAAKRSAAAEERSAIAQETQAQLAQVHADAAERFPWHIVRPEHSDFRLVNTTSTHKYDVDVRGQPVRRRPGEALHFDVVDGRETVELDLFVAAQTTDRSVTVSWRPSPDHTGDPWTQRIGLP